MDVSTNKPATAAVKSYEPAKNEKKTGSQEVVSEAVADKRPTDKLEISEEAQEKKETESVAENKVGNGFADFDMDAFQGSIRAQLMQSIHEAKNALREAGVGFAEYNEDSILYNLSELEKNGEVKAADIPEYWNAENTSQRIVDFAMSFRGLAPELSDEEYINQVRAAVEEGYRLAKKDLGDLPGPSAKLFNDTYNLTMSKFDDLIAKAQKGTA
ncbi:MAG: hypothetical protein FWC26_09930 [Fibromonadales bacterium]|nr:hypothetical protein [Fibromonadales bacterium]